jgi:hypothetical protein
MGEQSRTDFQSPVLRQGRGPRLHLAGVDEAGSYGQTIEHEPSIAEQVGHDPPELGLVVDPRVWIDLE